jgi:hypothetical protein
VIHNADAIVPIGTRMGEADARDGYDRAVTDPGQPLDEQLKEIGAQLAWVRDYL